MSLQGRSDLSQLKVQTLLVSCTQLSFPQFPEGHLPSLGGSRVEGPRRLAWAQGLYLLGVGCRRRKS